MVKCSHYLLKVCMVRVFLMYFGSFLFFFVSVFGGYNVHALKFLEKIPQI